MSMGLLNDMDWDGEVSQPGDAAKPIPLGTYYFTVSESTEKPTKDGTGAMLAMTFECLDEAYKGRKVYFNFNLSNRNKTAVDIGRKQLRAFCQVIGKRITDPAEAVGVVLKLKVKVIPHYKDQTKSVNDVSEFLPAGQAPPNPAIENKVAAAATGQPAQAPAPAGDEDTPF